VVANSTALPAIAAVLAPPAEDTTTPGRAGVVVCQLPLATITAPPLERQVRRDDDDADLATLAESLRLHGLLHPIGVRPLPTGRFEVVYGSRRLAAARSLGWTTIGCTLHLNMGDDGAVVTGLVENLHRRDLSPVQRTLALRMLAGMYRPGRQAGGRSSTGHQGIQPPERQPGSAGDLARRLGLTVGTVTRLAALGADEELLDQVERGELSLTAGSHLARVPGSLRRPLLDDARHGRLSATQVHLGVNRVLRERRGAEDVCDVAETPARPASGVAHRLKTVRGQLAAIDHITSTCERELLDDIEQQVRRLRAAAQLLESVA
jgi:hypothetical protein